MKRNQQYDIADRIATRLGVARNTIVNWYRAGEVRRKSLRRGRRRWYEYHVGDCERLAEQVEEQDTRRA